MPSILFASMCFPHFGQYSLTWLSGSLFNSEKYVCVRSRPTLTIQLRPIWWYKRDGLEQTLRLPPTAPCPYRTTLPEDFSHYTQTLTHASEFGISHKWYKLLDASSPIKVLRPKLPELAFSLSLDPAVSYFFLASEPLPLLNAFP